MQNEDYAETLNKIKKQFLCNVPVKDIRWEIFVKLDEKLQEEIINCTVRSNSVLKYPVNVNYQKNFLKKLLQHLEEENLDIAESLFEEYARLVALPDNDVNFKHYLLEDTEIVLKEDIHLISDGTTGLRTWQASLALSEWILTNKPHFKSKVIIELGSGIGLTGLVLLLQCKPEAVYLSDCHSSVLSALCNNVILNLKTNDTNTNNSNYLLHKNYNFSTVSVLNLPWQDVSEQFCDKLGKVDIIVAADVVYDKTVFTPLVTAVDFLFECCGAKELILSCTERSEETLGDFLSLLAKSYKVCDIEVPVQKNFVWAVVPPVKIFSAIKRD